MPETYPEVVEKVLQCVPVDGPLPREHVRIWWRWHDMLVNLLQASGVFYRGESIKNQGWATLLVVKGAVDGTPVVAFVTERTPTDCMRVFLRQVDERRVEWKEDKFA